MRNGITWGIVGMMVATLVGGAIWLVQTQRTAEVGQILRTDVVERGNLQLSVAASGSITSRERTELLVGAPGRVSDVLVSPNEQVSAGQVLAEMETGDLERAVRQAELAVEQAILALETAEAPADPEDLRLARLALASAGHDLEVARLGRETARVDANALRVQAQRQREAAHIRYREAPDGSDKERALTALEDAEAEERIANLNADLLLEQAEAQWRAAYARYGQVRDRLADLEAGPDTEQIRDRKLQVEQATLRLEQVQRRLRDMTITAPYDGVVAEVYISAGTQQRPGQPAFTLVDTSAYYVSVTIDEIDIGAIGVGQRADITLDAYPDRILHGTVDTIAPASSSLGGLVAYEVRLRILEPGETRILQGMTASVNIQTAVIEDVLLIPNWAVRIDQTSAEAFTYRLNGAQPQRAVLEQGRRNQTFTEVRSGLTENDIVALVVFERQPLLQRFGSAGPFGQ